MPKNESKGKGRSTTAVFINTCPRDVKMKFKIYCTRRGVSMSAALVALMRRAVAEQLAVGPGD